MLECFNSHMVGQKFLGPLYVFFISQSNFFFTMKLTQEAWKQMKINLLFFHLKVISFALLQFGTAIQTIYLNFEYYAVYNHSEAKYAISFFHFKILFFCVQDHLVLVYIWKKKEFLECFCPCPYYHFVMLVRVPKK